MKVATPLCWEGDESIDALTLSLANRLRFESYPRDENVVTEGSVVRAMYFVIRGHLKMDSRSLIHRPLGLRDGSYFGEHGLLACSISPYNFRTVRACDLLSLSSEAFAQVLHKHPFTHLALNVCNAAHRLLKSQQIESCLKSDMEERWGTALLRTLQEIQDLCPTTLAGSEHADADTDTDASFPASAVVLNAELTAMSTMWSAEGSASFGASGIIANMDGSGKQLLQHSNGKSAGATKTESTSKKFSTVNAEWGELPAHIGEMLEGLDTPQCYFEVFAPLLHIILATDPLDWKASFGAPSSAILSAAKITAEPLTPKS